MKLVSLVSFLVVRVDDHDEERGPVGLRVGGPRSRHASSLCDADKGVGYDLGNNWIVSETSQRLCDLWRGIATHMESLTGKIADHNRT